MFRLAHLSDVHLGPMPKIFWTRLLSKRITGYINWQRNRAKEFSPAVLRELTDHMIAANPDHVVVTGDLVNLALPEEISRAQKWLEALGTGEDISIVCGNHDSYIKGMLEVAITSWRQYLIGDDRIPVKDNADFPLLRRRGPCSIILVNTALPTKPFDATGLFDQGQAEKLEKLLIEEKDNCRVILIHHPPFANATKPANRLIGDDLFRDVVKKSGAELVLHGHTHLDTVNYIDGPNNKVPIDCVPAGGQGIGGKKPPARYNVFEIDRASDGWDIDQRRVGYHDEKPGIIDLGKTRLKR